MEWRSGVVMAMIYNKKSDPSSTSPLEVQLIWKFHLQPRIDIDKFLAK